MKHIIRFIISTIILLIQALILLHMGYSLANWEYWSIMVLTVCYMLVYVFF